MGARSPSAHQHGTLKRQQRASGPPPSIGAPITDTALQTSAQAIANRYSELGTDWLLEAQRIASLYAPHVPGAHQSSPLTEIARVNKFLRLVAEGNYLTTALLAAGFARENLAIWRRQADAGNVAAIALLDALEKAQAEAEADAVSDVRKAGKAGPQFWAASMTRLERRHPDRWGRRQDEGNAPKVVVQIGAGSGDVNVQIASLSPVPRNELTEISTSQVEIPRPIIGDSVNYAALPEHTARSSQDAQDAATQASDASARTKARRTAGGARRATRREAPRAGRG